MKEPDAEEFLSANKVEEGIRCAADAGAVIFGILIDGKELNAEKSDPTAHGIVIFSTSRRRNLQMLIDVDDEFVPIGVARYIAATKTLETRPRRQFEDNPQLVRYVCDIAGSSLSDDPSNSWNGSNYGQTLTVCQATPRFRRPESH